MFQLSTVDFLIRCEAFIVGIGVVVAGFVLGLVEPFVRKLKEIVKERNNKAEEECVAEGVDLERPDYCSCQLDNQSVDYEYEEPHRQHREWQGDEYKYGADEIVEK